MGHYDSLFEEEKRQGAKKRNAQIRAAWENELDEMSNEELTLMLKIVSNRDTISSFLRMIRNIL